MFLFSGLASGANLFVNVSSASCSDSHTRAEASKSTTPWCSFTAGLNNLQSGDTLVLATGEYNNVDGYTLSNRKFTSKTTITGAPNNFPVITSYIDPFQKTNTKWTKVSGSVANLWSATYTQDASILSVTVKSSNTSLFVYKSLSELTKSSNPRGVYFDNAANKIYLKWSDSSDPNKMGLLVSKSSILSMQNLAGAELEISNLIFLGGYSGIQVSASQPLISLSRLTLNNIDVIGGFNGIDIRGSRNVTIKNSNVGMKRDSGWWWSLMKGSNMETTGIYLQNDMNDILVDGNYVYGHFNGIMSYASTTGKFKSEIVRNNYLTDCYDDCIEIEDYCNSGLFTNNTINNAFTGFSLSPADASQGKCTISFNVINASRRIPFNSISSTEFQACFKIDSNTPMKNFLINQNTCVGRAIHSDPTYRPRNQRESTWINNLFYVDNGNRVIDGSGLASDNVLYDYNLYYRVGTGAIFRYWNSDTSATEFYLLNAALKSSQWNGKWDTHSVQVNPLLKMSNFQPASTSPACKMSSSGSYVGAVPCAGGTSIQTCTSDWQCSSWSTCTSNIQTRTCTDANSCSSSKTETQSCTTTDPPSPTESGLRGSWGLAGNYDDSEQNNDAVPYGSLLFVDSSTYGCSVLKFDKSNSYLKIDYANSALTPVNGFTVDITANLNSAKQGYIVKDVESYLLQEITVNGKAYVQAGVFSGNTWYPILTSSTSLNTGEWYRLTYTYDKDTGLFSLYINKKLDVQKKWTGKVDTAASSQILVGNRKELDRWTDGYMHGLHIYNRALDDAEVQKLS